MRQHLIGLTAGALLLGTAPSSAQPGFATRASVHFDVRYQRGVGEEAAEKIGDYLEADNTYLSATLGIELDRRVEVRVYDAPGKYLGGAGEKMSHRAAAAVRGVLHVQPPGRLPAGASLEKALSAELALIVLEPAERRGCPRWLREAFAAYHSGVVADLDAPIAMRVTAFADLEQEIQRPESPQRQESLQYLLGHTMRFLLERYGEERALGLFRAFNGEDGPDAIFRVRLGAGMQDVESEWVEYIVSHARPLKPAR